ncbi:Rieske 2Fe-2S domain-containing protein [Micromonospora sp. DR5-3]|uniref:Rieske (2Fe-2S) protein n=1 Tax=unclassified Micromonospora TaxID=2617518 RepID=UPI0011D6EA7F|nr:MULTISPECIES: Rieske 2Fe-2S domain-containing protein [unclassified Micromonospora]MCW3816440.1 Rieske 2Fe-2S domain-containing protein [Micromonospora sp. DR5-3]TYC21507.1 Rieske 2Fe-2S domain-containing protein [Micromonospora sp. MP36]
MSESDPVEWVLVAELSELARRKKKQVVVGGTPVALFLVNGRVFALHDVCVHKQRSLSKGTVLHGRIICPGHQWSFDPATGEAADQTECQPTYDVRVADGNVYVDPRPRTGRAQTGAAGHPVEVAG